MNKQQLNDIGIKIAKQCKDNTNDIVYIFFEALRNANSHNLQYKLYDTYLDYLDDCGAKQ